MKLSGLQLCAMLSCPERPLTPVHLVPATFLLFPAIVSPASSFHLCGGPAMRKVSKQIKPGINRKGHSSKQLNCRLIKCFSTAATSWPRSVEDLSSHCGGLSSETCRLSTVTKLHPLGGSKRGTPSQMGGLKDL